MIIPVRWISCGKTVGHLWEEFKERKGKDEDVKEILDDLGLDRYCCRSLFLTHTDLAGKAAKFKK